MESVHGKKEGEMRAQLFLTGLRRFITDYFRFFPFGRDSLPGIARSSLFAIYHLTLTCADP